MFNQVLYKSLVGVGLIALIALESSWAQGDKDFDDEFYGCQKLLAPNLYNPLDYVNDQTYKTRELLQSIPHKVNLGVVADIEPTRNGLFDLLYEEAGLRSDEAMKLMRDKLIMARLIRSSLPHDLTDDFHVKTFGVKELLLKLEIINKFGEVLQSKSEILKRLNGAFEGKGFVIKPTIGMSSSGKGFFADEEAVAEMIASGEHQLFDDMLFPQNSSDLKDFASGEHYMFMEKISGTKLVSDEKEQKFLEFRVHSLENRVVIGATENRWYDSDYDQYKNGAEDFITQLFAHLPSYMWSGVAFSFDVHRDESGKYKLIEVNTNRGGKNSWSGFMRTPRTLGAYVRHLEQFYAWDFLGFSGEVLRNNLGNLKSYIKIETIYAYNDLLDPDEDNTENLLLLGTLYEEFFLPFEKLVASRGMEDNEKFKNILIFSREFKREIDRIKDPESPKDWFHLFAWAEKTFYQDISYLSPFKLENFHELP